MSVDIKGLGDQIAELTLKEAKELSDYLKEEYNIEPAAGGAVMVAGGPAGDAGPAEEEKTELIDSVEDILQASLNFEKSNPEKRFSSSLDFYYSSTTQNLYPSLEEVSEPPLSQQESSTRQESVDSVGTSFADVVASTTSAMEDEMGGKVPEPPGSETYAIASAAYAARAVDEEEDVKIGVARAEMERAETDSPAVSTGRG